MRTNATVAAPVPSDSDNKTMPTAHHHPVGNSYTTPGAKGILPTGLSPGIAPGIAPGIGLAPGIAPGIAPRISLNRPLQTLAGIPSPLQY